MEKASSEPQGKPAKTFKTPLLKEEKIRSYTFDAERPEDGLKLVEGGGDAEEGGQGGSHHAITDAMMYRTRSLTTWEAFTINGKLIIFTNPELWAMMLRLALVSASVCVIALLVIPKPERLQAAKFTAVSKFLNVVVGLLLGFFLSSSMTRWYTCVNGFLELLDAIRNLQMQFVALGVPEEQTVLCLRWGFASAWLLYRQLIRETERLSGAEFDHDEMWRKLCAKVTHIDKSGKANLLKEEEADVLRLTRDPPGMMWMWNAALIGRLAQDGWIPPMQTPTYGRIMNLCQSAHGGIRQVRQAISIQAPLTYTHMLATLVHINNLLNAVTLGLVSGVAIGVWLIRHGYHFYTHDTPGREVAQDWQNMAVTFLYCFFGPLLYQALLLISMHLAQPFDGEEAKIPLDRLLVQLEIDMCNGRDLTDHLCFDKPAFKKAS